MTYTQEQIEKLKYYAECMMTIDEVAILMDIDRYELRDDVNNRKSEAFIYRKTMVEKALEIRQSEMELAQAGSPAALQNAVGFLHNMIDALR